MRRRAILALIVVSGLMLGTMPPAAGLTVTHEREIVQGRIHWRCPGEDPLERYTLSSRSTTFERDGMRIRVISHLKWRGDIRHRETGELIRDEADWTETAWFRGRRLLRVAITGVVWRVTIPGHGIVVHQSGRAVFASGESSFTSTFGDFADIGALCRYT